ncbi:MAG: PAS domain-containing protein [Sphingomonadaceae bacterium]
MAELPPAAAIWDGILAASPDAILLLHADGRVAVANPLAAAQLGVPAGTLVGQLYGASLPATLRASRQQQIASALQQQRALRWEDGLDDRRYVLTAIPVQGNAHVLLNCRDVSVQHRLEESEQNKRARLKTLIETLPDLVWLQDRDGVYINCNQKFERFLGAPEAGLKGCSAAALLPPALQASFHLHGARALQTLQPQIFHQWLEFVADGHREYAEVILAPFIDQHGEVMGVMGIARDVTAFQQNADELRRHRDQLEQLVSARTAELSRTVEQLQRTQNELVQAEKLASLGALVAGISHELNTPLGNLLTISSALRDEHAGFLQQLTQGAITRSALQQRFARDQEMLELVERSARRAADLIDNFKQVAVDQTSDHRHRFDLHELVAAQVPGLLAEAGRKAVVIHNQIAPGIACDSFPGPLGQVVTHLLQNALRHAFDGRAGGSIQLSCVRDDEQLALSVSDDGIGMDAAMLLRIFDPFFTTKLGRGGSGLGLPVCKRIANGVLAGDLVAQSQPGHGSSFTLTMSRTAPGTNLAL